MKIKTNKEKEKKYELTGLTLQTRLTRHTLNSYRESLIIKKEKKQTNGLTQN
jgi:hypothetical protein